MFQLFSHSWLLFYLGILSNSFLILFLRQVNVALLDVNLHVVLIDSDCFVEHFKCLVIFAYFRKSASRVVQNSQIECRV